MLLTGFAAQAQDSLSLRKLYVPEDAPAEWPRGNWRPISTRKFLQQMEIWDSSRNSQPLPALTKVAYSCRFEQGKLVAGHLQADIQSQTQPSGWINLGRTNLPLSVSSQSPEVIWGTGQDQNLYLFHDTSQGTVSADWEMPGVSIPQGHRFQLRLLPAMQTQFSIFLPEHLTLSFPQTRQPPVFRRQADNNLQEWTIQGLESSTLEFTIETSTPKQIEQVTLSRSVHLLDLSPAQQTFVSEFKLERLDGLFEQLEILLPAGFQPDSVHWQQEPVTTWQLQSADSTGENSQAGQRLLIPLRNPFGVTNGQLRIRGTLRHFQQLELETTFPQLQNTLCLDQQVNLLVSAPYLLKNLKTSGLEQIDSRFATGVRDVWSYTAISNQPELHLQVHIPEPDLTIDQLLFLEVGENEVDIHQIMLWSTTEERRFHGRFLIGPEFDVQNVTQLSEQANPPALSWNVLHQEGLKILQIHLPNQLVPGQPLPIAVSLKTKLLDREERWKLPVLIPVHARIGHSYLVEQDHLSIEKVQPEAALLSDLTIEETTRWAILNKLPASQSQYRWQPHWRIKNFSAATELVVALASAVAKPAATETPAATLPQLTTEILSQQQETMIRYRVTVPRETLEQQTSLAVHFSAPLPQLQWSEVKTLAEKAVAEEFADPQTEPVRIQKVVDAQGGNHYLLEWEHPTVQQTFEAYWKPTDTVLPALPLPLLREGQAFTGTILWDAAQLEVRSSASPPQNPPTSSAPGEIRYDATAKPLDFVVQPHQKPADPAPAALSHWSCQLHALMHNTPEIDNQIFVAYQLLDQTPDLKRQQFQFETPVHLSGVRINGVDYRVEQTLQTYQLPIVNAPVHSIELHYLSPGGEVLPLPQPNFSFQFPGLVVAVPAQTVPVSTAQIPFWNRISLAALLAAKPAVANSFTEQPVPLPAQSATEITVEIKPEIKVEERNNPLTNEFLQDYVTRQQYQLYEGFLQVPEGQALTISLQGVPRIWPSVLTGFGLTLLAFLILSTLFACSSRQWLLPTLFVAFLTILAPGLMNQTYLYPVLMGLILVTWGADCWHQLLLKLRQSPPKKIADPPSRSKGSFVTTTALLVLTAYLLSQTLVTQAQPVPKPETQRSDSLPAGRYDVLVPLRADQLQTAPEHLTSDDYPDVIYISAQLAQTLADKVAANHSLNQLLYQSATYQANWQDDERWLLRCEYQLLDPSQGPPRSRLVLPLKNIHALTPLRAMVNEQTVNITPLPDGSGLEIPLPTEFSDEDTPAAETRSTLSKSFRRYRIQLDIIPNQTETPAGLRSRLVVPPVIHSQLQWTTPEFVTVQFQPVNHETPVSFPTGTVPLSVGSLSQLVLIAQADSMTPLMQASNSYQATLSSLLCQVHRSHAELRMNLELGFPGSLESTREILLELPPVLMLRGLHSPDITKHQLRETESQSRELLLTVDPKGSRTKTVLLTFVMPLEQGNPDLELPFPRLLDETALPSQGLSWQIALQTAHPLQITGVEFPEAASSRIPREVFLANWPEADLLHLDVQCFRAKEPELLKAKLQEISSQLTVNATHTYRVSPQAFELTSRLRGQLTGKPLWLLEFQNPESWILQTAKVLLDGQEVPVRILQNPKHLQLATAIRLADQFELQLTWKKEPPEVAEEFPVTPPRLLQSYSYRETVSLKDSSLKDKQSTGWGLLQRHPDAAERDVPSTPLATATVQEASTESLPEWWLKRTPATTETLTNPETSTATPPALSTDQPAMTDVSRPADVESQATTEAIQMGTEGIRLDHSLWTSGQTLFGETLIRWPIPEPGTEPTRFTVELPPGCELISNSGAPYTTTEQVDHQLHMTVSPPEDIARHRLRFLVLHWKTARTGSLTGNAQILLPLVEKADRVHWRMLITGSTPVDFELTPVAENSWQEYLSLLRQIGQIRFQESTPLPTSQPPLSSLLISDWPQRIQAYYQQLPANAQQEIQAGLQRLHYRIDSKPGPLFFGQILTAGTCNTSHCPVTIPHSSPVLPRTTMLGLIGLWGALIWRREELLPLTQWLLPATTGLLLLIYLLRLF